MSVIGHVAVQSSTAKDISKIFSNMKIDKNMTFEISKNEIHLIVMNFTCIMSLR